MTLRLAKVFRYLLAHSGRPLTSIHEEMDFLRTYLDIEEARFGERLKVEIDFAPEIGSENIPSLILQPIVENALAAIRGVRLHRIEMRGAAGGKCGSGGSNGECADRDRDVGERV
jgi:two-component system LytT family sensor kinase